MRSTMSALVMVIGPALSVGAPAGSGWSGARARRRAVRWPRRRSACGPPCDAILAHAERGEEVRADALQIEEVDRRPAALDPACRPCAVEKDGHRERFARPPVGVAAVALAQLEGPDELRPAVDIQA